MKVEEEKQREGDVCECGHARMTHVVRCYAMKCKCMRFVKRENKVEVK